MKADLHLHSCYSDGTDPPAEVVRRADQLHLDAIALTDHDTLDGTAEALVEGRHQGLRVIPAAEITARFRQHELHVLAYFHPESGPAEGWRSPALVEQLQRHSRIRIQRITRIVERLKELGIPITLEQVQLAAATLAHTGSKKDGNHDEGTLGRPHVAAALVAAGHVTSIDQAFNRYLKRGRPAWVDKERSEVREVLALIRQTGGLSSLAHPGLLPDQNIPAQLLSEGFDGIEVFHSRHSVAQSNRFHRMAEERGLLVTGGSDCHGQLKGEPLMGRAFLEGGDLDRFLARLGTPRASS